MAVLVAVAGVAVFVLIAVHTATPAAGNLPGPDLQPLQVPGLLLILKKYRKKLINTVDMVQCTWYNVTIEKEKKKARRSWYLLQAMRSTIYHNWVRDIKG